VTTSRAISTKPFAKRRDGYVFTVKTKLDCLDQMAFDTGLSHRAFRVGYGIVWCVNRKTGTARVSRTTLAAKFRISVRTVEHAIKELVLRGHIEVDKTCIGFDETGRPIHGGRGNANVYRPVARTANAASPFPASERANGAPEKGEEEVPKGRTVVRSFPLTTRTLPEGANEGAPEIQTLTAEQINPSGFAFRKRFVSRDDQRWKPLETRWRREENPRGVPTTTSEHHGHKSGWYFPADWVADLEGDQDRDDASSDGEAS